MRGLSIAFSGSVNMPFLEYGSRNKVHLECREREWGTITITYDCARERLMSGLLLLATTCTPRGSVLFWDVDNWSGQEYAYPTHEEIRGLSHISNLPITVYA